MTKLSVNINKIATLRNSRGGDLPNVVKAALDAERFGAQGITVHPRPDERHIRYADVRDIKRAIAEAFVTAGLSSAVPDVTVTEPSPRPSAKNVADEILGE